MRQPDMTQQDSADSPNFNQLKWSLQALAVGASDQLALFPEQETKADNLALEFKHWADRVRADNGEDLSPQQHDVLSTIDRKLTTMSRDGAEFDADLWTDAALRDSEQWAEVRTLARSALEAFGWPEASPAGDDANAAS